MQTKTDYYFPRSVTATTTGSKVQRYNTLSLSNQKDFKYT